MVSRVKVSNVRSVGGVDVCDVEFFDTDGSLPKLEGVPCVSVCKFMSGAESAVETELDTGMVQSLSGGVGGSGDESDFHKLVMQGFRDNRLISDLVDFGFSDADLKELALMHRDGDKDLKSYIEDLLTDCNFHTESGAFRAGMYDDYLGEGDASGAFCVDDIVLMGYDGQFYYHDIDIDDGVLVPMNDYRAFDKWARRHGVYERGNCESINIGFNLTLLGLKKLHKRMHDFDSGLKECVYATGVSSSYAIKGVRDVRPLGENIGFVHAFDQVMSGEAQSVSGCAPNGAVYFDFMLRICEDNAVWDGASFINLHLCFDEYDNFISDELDNVLLYDEELFSVVRMAFMQKYGLKGAVLGEGLRGLIGKEIQESQLA